MACSNGVCECKWLRRKCQTCGDAYLLDAYDIETLAAEMTGDDKVASLKAYQVQRGIACYECQRKAAARAVMAVHDKTIEKLKGWIGR